jgi:hypothetical protein
MKFKAALIAVSALVAGTAVADDNGFYAGAGAGWSQLSLPKSKLTNDAVDLPAAFGYPLDPSISAKTDDNDIMWSAFVGYRFMKYLAVEAGYLDTGTGSYTLRGTTGTIPPATLTQAAPVSVKAEWNGTGWPVSVLGIWPINDNWDVFGRVGGFFGDVRTEVRLQVYEPTDPTDPTTGGLYDSGKGHTSGSSTEFIYGVGVDGRFLENWAARFEWLAIPSLGDSDTGEADWNAFQFALLYRF